MLQMFKPTKIIHALVFVTVFFFTFGAYAFAYNNYDNAPCKWESPGSVKYKFIGDTPSDYRIIFATAVVNFNDTPTRVYLSLDYDGTTANLFGIFNEDSNTMGRTIWYCKPFSSYISSADAGLNNLFFYNSTDPRKGELQIKVAHHEVGHFLGLGHSTVTPAVMQSGIYYYQEPKQDDIDGLNSIYPW